MTTKKILLGCAAVVAMSVGAADVRSFVVESDRLGAEIQPTMYGIFYEDVNFAGDSGLYAELVANRSFEYPQNLMCWDSFGRVTVRDDKPAFERNAHYVSLEPSGHAHRWTGLRNRGFFGMGFKKGEKYDFSTYARLDLANGQKARIRVELLSGDNSVLTNVVVEVTGHKWQRYAAELTAPVTEAKGMLRIVLEKDSEGVDLDHISLFPADNWHGLRTDLVRALEELKPGVFRFPGGCIVEGVDLATRYRWKETVGPAENRPVNENLWQCWGERMFPYYFQSCGLGYYEYFLLAERLGAEPLPVVSVGLACQCRNREDDPAACVAVTNLQEYVDDALDLIEFANGPVDSKWGAIRAQMGHSAPFGMKQIGIGNEQWGQAYVERAKVIIAAIRAKYPEIQICGSVGPFMDTEQSDFLWKAMREIGVEKVDEHYYRAPDWFKKSAARYDGYDRKGPKVFAGEYAAIVAGGSNSFETALAEAAFMTGFERNADVVYQSAYAPLFARVDGWQWHPDLIWFDNLSVVRTPNYYVQQMYAQNAGTHVVALTEGGKAVTGAGGLYATACFDKKANDYIVKIANVSTNAQEVAISFKGIAALGAGTLTTLHADNPNAHNTLAEPNVVVPMVAAIQPTGTVQKLTLQPLSFVVLRVGKR